MASESERNRLPFEPSRKRKKADKKSTAVPAETNRTAQVAPVSPKARRDRPDTKIPEVVSQRMLKRMLAFSGVPTFLGVGVFFVSYVLIVRQIVDLPNVAVLLVSMGCFGLGVVGLSYGALSASWDESRPGNWLGLDEFQVNLGRMFGAWREAREERRAAKPDN
jgi:hypothetical protein